MASGLKCKNCGSSNIEVDSGRGDAVCTNCGSVIESVIIVSEVQFEEAAHGTSSAVGQFVAADSKGGATGYGKFHVGVGTESREVTLRKARQGITHLSHQLHLNNHCIDTACNFFKMALMRHLTRGRKNTHIYAACVYITCRTEGTSHLLIDISDVLQICCYELGRTYLKLSQALCINLPSIDPCLYIMRFATKLEFGEKTHEVSMTAQRLVQRMMKDSIHSGRRPSGLCGAALLIAARMHDYNRTPMDIVRIVKIHESTLRKRLIEFGDTPSSMLTLDEFMAVDLEAEQDPPAFKAARKRDKERLQKLPEHEAEFTDLQREIDSYLDQELRRGSRKRRNDLSESEETDKFIRNSTLDVINECLEENVDDPASDDRLAYNRENEQTQQTETGELDTDGLDDEEIDGYIMTEDESKYKDEMWNKLNADYLREAKAKEERLAKEKEEGKPEKKKRRVSRKKNIGPSNTAGEAIEKMLQEKKISTKINYEILKTLTSPSVATTSITTTITDNEPNNTNELKTENLNAPSASTSYSSTFKQPRRKQEPVLNIKSSKLKPYELAKTLIKKSEMSEDENAEEDDIDEEIGQDTEQISLASMLNAGDDYYGYDETY
ncbi:transcription factor IIIB 90 kDa subunit isoform X2 [Contarinia nasturtii]|uniref:transcription factor IIIB 90 kDa subunit isoform X2 n=1 Tax=Contarinia nasturtii TaxID=265458 RepID=UPI0012D3AB61|nr:transcription factor IIIB 90 kDa subunit isoform X2 [Contarinia nasturtii]